MSEEPARPGQICDVQCWLPPKAFALNRAADAFDADGTLVSEAHRNNVRAVIDQVLWAAQRLHSEHCPDHRDTAARIEGKTSHAYSIAQRAG